MAVLYQRPARGLSTFTAKLRRIYGNPARTYEYVSGYGTGGRSSHNADSNGVAHAVDVFVGPGNLSEAQGIDLAERLRAEGKRGKIPGHPDRLAYIIHRGRIAGDHSNWEWIPYTGLDWHGDHIHISSVFDYLWGEVVAGNPADYDSTADWDLWESEFQPATPQSGNTQPIQEDDVVTPEDRMAIVKDLLDYQLNQVGGGKISLSQMLSEYRPHVTTTHDKLTKLPNSVVNAEFPRINTQGKVDGAATLSSVLGVHDANVVLTRGVITGAAEAVAKAVAAIKTDSGISPEEQGKRAAAAFLSEVEGLSLSITGGNK